MTFMTLKRRFDFPVSSFGKSPTSKESPDESFVRELATSKLETRKAFCQKQTGDEAHCSSPAILNLN